MSRAAENTCIGCLLLPLPQWAFQATSHVPLSALKAIASTDTTYVLQVFPTFKLRGAVGAE